MKKAARSARAFERAVEACRQKLTDGRPAARPTLLDTLLICALFAYCGRHFTKASRQRGSSSNLIFRGEQRRRMTRLLTSFAAHPDQKLALVGFLARPRRHASKPLTPHERRRPWMSTKSQIRPHKRMAISGCDHRWTAIGAAQFFRIRPNSLLKRWLYRSLVDG